MSSSTDNGAGSAPAAWAPAVKLSAVGLRFGTLKVFEDLEMAFPAARTTCLLGASGVGKTSLLRLIAGLSTQATGHVGDEAGTPLSGRVAYMAQEDLLLPWFSVLQNVCLGARLRGESLHESMLDRARELLKSVGLGDWESARPGELSGGMRQRVALARTLMEERPLVLMDEPFAALDAITRFEIQALSGRLLQGRTVIMVTHDPAEALRMCHRIHVLSGRPAQVGSALELAGAPPRQPGTAELARLHADLLTELTAGRAELADRMGEGKQ
jgi:putative hydroxymethylpyrimidine transport system ATP-binding protein